MKIIEQYIVNTSHGFQLLLKTEEGKYFRTSNSHGPFDMCWVEITSFQAEDLISNS